MVANGLAAVADDIQKANSAGNDTHLGKKSPEYEIKLVRQGHKGHQL